MIARPQSKPGPRDVSDLRSSLLDQANALHEFNVAIDHGFAFFGRELVPHREQGGICDGLGGSFAFGRWPKVVAAFVVRVFAMNAAVNRATLLFLEGRDGGNIDVSSIYEMACRFAEAGGMEW